MRDCIGSSEFDEILLSSHWSREPMIYKTFKLGHLREALVVGIQAVIDAREGG